VDMIESAVGTRARILVVEDEPMNLTAFSRLLRGNYEVLAAPSGARALEIVTGAAKPDLILLDVLMPGMNGLQVLERLQGDPLTREIPVILITVLDTQDSHAEGFRAGAVDFIAKPFGPDIVLARIATHLALKKAADELAACKNSVEAEVVRRTSELGQIRGVRNAENPLKGNLSVAEAHELRACLLAALEPAQPQSMPAHNDEQLIEVRITTGRAKSLLAIINDRLDISG